MGRSLAQGRVRHRGTGCPIRRGFRRMGIDTAGTKERAPNYFKEEHSGLRSVEHAGLGGTFFVGER